MAVESRRGCGYRKIGGLYLVGSGLGRPCCKLPIPLNVCPTCNQGVKQTRGWSWVDPKPWLAGPCSRSHACPLAHPENLGDKVGLLWIGTQFYKTPEDFMGEATLQGVSRRIRKVPRGFVVGESWVFLAHPKTIAVQERVEHPDHPDGLLGTVWKPGIFHVFRPYAVELIVTETQAKDDEAMEALRKRGITPFVVPDNDKDHQGSVYDDDEQEPELELN